MARFEPTNKSIKCVYLPKSLAVSMSATLPIMEHFFTIQGEGAHTGQAAYFIRIGGCDVGCKWCDVKESWDASVHPGMTVQALLDVVLASKAQNVVITGGEPCMYDLTELCLQFKAAGLSLWLETSGAYPITGEWHWLCLSPKRFKACMEENYVKADELKVVVSRPKDFEWAEGHVEKLNAQCLLYLQPEWGQQEAILPGIISYVKDHSKWRISLQSHKFMVIP